MAPAQRLRLPRQSSVVSAAHPGFSPWFLLPLLCASCCRFWLFFSASDCFSAGSLFLSSGFAALGWGSAPAVFHGLVLPQVPRPSCLPFSLFPDLRFCPVPSPNPLGSAASASAHGLSGVQYSASSSTSGLLGLSFSPPVPLFSLPQPVVRSATSSAPLSRSTFGFSFCRPFAPRWWLLWRWLQILRLGCLLPFLAPFVLSLTSCVFCCLCSSPDF